LLAVWTGRFCGWLAVLGGRRWCRLSAALTCHCRCASGCGEPSLTLQWLRSHRGMLAGCWCTVGRCNALASHQPAPGWALRTPPRRCMRVNHLRSGEQLRPTRRLPMLPPQDNVVREAQTCPFEAARAVRFVSGPCQITVLPALTPLSTADQQARGSDLHQVRGVQHAERGSLVCGHGRLASTRMQTHGRRRRPAHAPPRPCWPQLRWDGGAFPLRLQLIWQQP